MPTIVRKWGNSLGIRIPRAFAEETGLAEGIEVDLALTDAGLLVRPLARRWVLAELLAGVTRRNRHREVGTGRARGRESW